MNVRKIKNTTIKEDLETRIIDGESEGFSYIELSRKVRSGFIEIMMNLNELAIREERKAGHGGAVTTVTKVIEDGVLRFYPDGKERGWAYMLDTPRNRLFLAEQLAKPVVNIQDSRIKDDIVKLAIKSGFRTEPGPRLDTSIDGYLKTSDTLAAEIEKDDEVEQLKIKLAKAEATIAATEEGIAKPLKGTTAAKRDTKTRINR